MISISLLNGFIKDHRIHVVTLLCGNPQLAHEVGDLIFSMIANNQNRTLARITITIFLDDYGLTYLSPCLDKLRAKIDLDIRPFSLLRKLNFFNEIEEKDKRFYCAIHKLMLPDVLSDIDRFIYLDVDTLIYEDISSLWEIFHTTGKGKLLIGGLEFGNQTDKWYKDHNKNHFYPPTGINSGVLLFNRELLKKHNVSAQTFLSANTEKILLPDQDILNSWAYHNQDLVGLFPCKWNKRLGCNCPDTSNSEVMRTDTGIFHGNGGILRWKYSYLSLRYQQLFRDTCGYYWYNNMNGM